MFRARILFSTLAWDAFVMRSNSSLRTLLDRHPKCLSQSGPTELPQELSAHGIRHLSILHVLDDNRFRCVFKAAGDGADRSLGAVDGDGGCFRATRNRKLGSWPGLHILQVCSNA